MCSRVHDLNSQSFKLRGIEIERDRERSNIQQLCGLTVSNNNGEQRPLSSPVAAGTATKGGCFRRVQPLSIDIPASSSPPTPPYQTHHRRAILFPFLSINSSVPLFRPFSPPFFSYSPNASHSSQPPRFPIPSPSSLALLFLLERPRESLSSFRTLLPTVPLPHSHRPRRYRFLSSSSALLLSHPSQASRVCRPRRRARCTSSSSSVEPSFRVCQLVFPLARRGPRGGGGGRKERRRPGDVMERVTRETREENGGKGRRTKGASSSNRKLPKYFTS